MQQVHKSSQVPSFVAPPTQEGGRGHALRKKKKEKAAHVYDKIMRGGGTEDENI